LSEVPLLAFSLAVVRVDRIVVLASTSIRGIEYDANPRTAVSHGSLTSHPSRRCAVVPLIESWGRASHNAQVFRTPRPVDVPSCNVSRLAMRAVAFMSTPCQ